MPGDVVWIILVQDCSEHGDVRLVFITDEFVYQLRRADQLN